MAGLVIAAVLILAVVLWLKRRKGGGPKTSTSTWPVKPKKPLTDQERVIYFALKLALPEQVVLAQVALSQLVYVSAKGNQAIRNKINPLVADFVICDKTFRVLAIIELDGSSHDQPRRQNADANKEKALIDAGLKFLRWNSKALPTKDEMRKVVLS